MRQVIATFTASVNGNRSSVTIVPDAVIDLDQVVGESGGRLETLEAALTPELVALCVPVVPVVPAVPAQDDEAPAARGRLARHRGDGAAKEQE